MILAAALGAMFGLAGALVIWAWSSWREPLPRLSPQDFDEAQRRWRENEPLDYDIEVEVSGPQPAVYRVEVRNGEPVSAFRNGRELTQRRTWATWSVPGMFGTLASDFRHAAQREAGLADENTPRVSLYGVFDPVYGYPRHYRRIMLGQGAEESMAHRIGQGAAAGGDSAMVVSWKVRDFKPRGPGARPQAAAPAARPQRIGLPVHQSFQNLARISQARDLTPGGSDLGFRCKGKRCMSQLLTALRPLAGFAGRIGSG
jgi:hypothetical protein